VVRDPNMKAWFAQGAVCWRDVAACRLELCDKAPNSD
jgi:hypothetical protein